MNNNYKIAFTLVELLVVIAIIGILSGLIVVGMSSSVDSARIAKSEIFSSSLRDSLLGSLEGDFTLDATYNDTWNNNTGTALGTPTSQTSGCPQNTCYSFNGTADAITWPDINAYTMGTQMTAMVWEKGVSQTGKVVFAHWDATGTGTLRGEWEILGAAGGTLRVVVSNDGTATTLAKDYVTSSVVAFDNKWHLVGFTLAPGVTTGTLTLYVDGVSAAVTQTVNGNVPSVYTSTAVLSMACSVTGAACTAGTFFAGQIDNARLYTATIPTSQIRDYYYVGLNDLLRKGEITQTEYQQRVASMASSLAKK